MLQTINQKGTNNYNCLTFVLVHKGVFLLQQEKAFDGFDALERVLGERKR